MAKNKPTTIDAEVADSADKAEEEMTDNDELVTQGNPPNTLAKLPSTELTPGQMLSTLVQQGAAPEVLSQFMDLQDRWEAKEAKKSYVVAMGKFKKEAIKVLKDKHVKYENKDGSLTEYDHARLFKICEVVVPFLSKHGFIHTWSYDQSVKDLITVTCIITHKLGHSESVPLTGPHDRSGGKNSIQAIGSSTQYLERYTFLAICGLTASDQDDDGAGSEIPEESGEVLSEEQANTMSAMIDEHNLDQEGFLKFINKTSIPSIKATSYTWCIEQIEFVVKRHKANAEKVAK